MYVPGRARTIAAVEPAGPAPTTTACRPSQGFVRTASACCTVSAQSTRACLRGRLGLAAPCRCAKHCPCMLRSAILCIMRNRWQSAPGSARPRRASAGRQHLGAGGYMQTSHYSEDRRLGDSLLKHSSCFHVGHLATPCRHGCARLLRVPRAARDPWLPAALIRAWRSCLRVPSYSWAHACEQAAHVVLANAGQVMQGPASSGSLRGR